MSRTSILAAAAIAALGISAFAMTDASAAARGGAKVARGGGGSVSRVAVHPGSHGGGLHRGGTHRSTIARISHPGRTGIGRRLPPGIMIARNPPGTPSRTTY